MKQKTEKRNRSIFKTNITAELNKKDKKTSAEVKEFSSHCHKLNIWPRMNHLNILNPRYFI